MSDTVNFFIFCQVTPIEVSRLIQFLIVRNSEEQLIKAQEKLWTKYKYKYNKAVKRQLPCLVPFFLTGFFLTSTIYREFFLQIDHCAGARVIFVAEGENGA